MSIRTYFTIHETAALSGATKTFIEKSLEARVVAPVTRSDDVRGEQVRHLPFGAVIFFAALRATRLQTLPLKHKRALWARMRHVQDENLLPIEVMPGIVFDIERLTGDTARLAAEYREAKRRYLVSDPDILGGTPVIRGTRITAYSVAGRLANGDGIDDLTEDYPEVPVAAFKAADLYARTHPLRGRPSGRPWLASPSN